MARTRPSKRKTWPIVLVGALFVAICGLCSLLSIIGLLGAPKSSGTSSQSSSGIGDSVSDGGLSFTVEKIDCSSSSVGKDPLSKKAQGKFCVVSLVVTNTGNSAQNFVSSNQKALDAGGREYSSDSAAALLLDSGAWVSQINPGSTMRGSIVFDVPAGVQLTTLVLRDGMFSSGVRVKVS